MAESPPPDPAKRLEGWKAIADYLGRDQRTARRWQTEEGLPVYKDTYTLRGRVFAYPAEIDAWRNRSRVPGGTSHSPAVEDEVTGESSVAGSPLVSTVSMSDASEAEARHHSEASEDGTKRSGYSGQGIRRLAPWLACLVLCSVAVVIAFVVSREGAGPPVGLRIGRVLSKATSEGTHPIQISLPIPTGSLVASRDGENVFVFQHEMREIYAVRVGDPTVRRIDAGIPIRSLALSKGGKTLYVGASSRGLKAIELGSGKTRDYQTDGGVNDVALSPDGKVAYVAMGTRGVRKISLATGESSIVTLHPAPFFLALDKTGEKLYVSYQNGGPGGRDGHDTLGVFDLLSGKTMTSVAGPPLVGGPPTVSPATGDIWVQMWDACVTKTYDRIGCPPVPSYGFQIFRSQDLMLVKSLYWPERMDSQAHFVGDGSRVVVPGPAMEVLDSARFRRLERFPMQTFNTASSEDGRKVFVLCRNRLLIFDAVPADCFDVNVPLAQEFSFDGSLQDAIEATAFQPAKDVTFIAGRVGQAVRLTAGTDMRMRSPSDSRLGDDSSPRVSMALWFRARGNGTLLERGSSTPFKLKWDAGKVRFTIEPGLLLEAAAASGQWHHVVISRADSFYTMYLNGHLVASGTSEVKEIGPYSAEFLSSGDADLDELAMYKENLPDSAIAKLSSMGPHGHCPPR